MSAGRTTVGSVRIRVGRFWGILLLGLVASSAWVSHAADEGPAVGLRGIVPEGVPVDLTATIASLPETWQPWGEGLTGELVALYETPGLDVAGQRAAIASLETRLKTLRTALADTKYRSAITELVGLHGSLKRRVDLAKAVLDTLELGPEVKAAAVSAARKEVDRTAQELDGYLGRIKGGAGWVKYLQTSDVRSGLADESQAVMKLASVQNRLKARDEQTDEQVRNFMSKPQFIAYEQAVDAYLAATAAAAIHANSPELRQALASLMKAVEDYELTPTSATAAAVRQAYQGLPGVAPDGGDRVTAALRSHYFNYNLRLVASESFLNRVISETRTECGSVSDCILGASVSGSQMTVTTVSANLLPSSTVALFDITANGAISSDTAGVTDMATVYTHGNHHFTASKRVMFNGDQFWTEGGRIGIHANNQTVDAETQFSWIPLLGSLVDNIAISKAEEMRPESEAIAAGKIRDQVMPRFDSEIDGQFGSSGKVNGELSERIGALHELRLYPDAKAWSTTDTELRGMSRVMTAGELGGGDPNPALVLGRGATVLIHQSLMNNTVDRMDLKGQTLTDDQFKAKIQDHMTRLLGREVKLGDDKPVDVEESAKSLIFDGNDPIRFRAADGVLNVILRAGLRQEGKEDIPPQLITIPLRFTVDDKNVVVDPGNISVEAIGDVANAAEQGVRAGVIRKKIGAAFPRREIDRVAHIERDGRKVMVAVTRIKALDGWLSVTVE